MKKIMFFAYDGTGLGHLMRLIKIALGLSEFCKVLVVSGHKALPYIIPDGIEYALIPNFVDMRDKNGYTNEQTNNIRISIIDKIFNDFVPDAFVTDYLPYGKRCELANIITKANCLKYFILRSEIGGERLVHEDVFSVRNIDILAKYYTRILIASDPAITPMEQYLWLPVKIKEMISYIGFVTYSVSDNDIKIVRNNYLSSSNQKWMVCSAGGGKKGEEFINKCIELSRDNRLKDWKVDIIFGYYSSILWPFGDVLNYTTKNVTFHKWINNLYLLHASADCVVCSGGYNTLTETMQGIRKHVFSYSVMNYEEEDEQVNNIRGLSKYYYIKEIESLNMLVETIIDSIHDFHNFNQIQLNMNGIKNATSIIIKDLNNINTK